VYKIYLLIIEILILYSEINDHNKYPLLV